MWHWISSVFHTWSVWQSGYVEGKMLDEFFPWIVIGTAMLTFGVALWVCIHEGKKFWDTVGAGLGVTFGVTLVVALVSVIVIAIFPLIVLMATLFSGVLAVVGLAYYGPMLVQKIPWKKLFAFRKKLTPTDHLVELDEKATEVDMRLLHLVQQKDALEKEKIRIVQDLGEAERRRKSARSESAAAQIADDLIAKFRKKLNANTICLAKVQAIIFQVQAGKDEMHNLIGLAKLHRRANEADTMEDSQAIQAARQALNALREAFERADAVLAASISETADGDLSLAFQQIDEGFRRSAQLSDSAESISAPIPSRTRA